MILAVCPNPSVDKYLRVFSLEPGNVNKSTFEKSYPGGKGVHVGLALKELGLESHITGFWGGPTGAWVKDQCRTKGVDCSGPELNEWTRTCLTIQSEEQSHETEILEQGPEINENEVQCFQKIVSRQMTQSKIVCVSGSWPLGTDGDIYKIFQKCHGQKLPVWIDASGERLKQAVKIQPHGIHVNRTEAESFFGRSDKPARYARDLLTFCKIAAVTDGANGLYLASGDKLLHANCPAENIISTVGCGDCLLAGMISAQYNAESLEMMARTGVACGAANCLRPDLGMLYKKDVDHLMRIAAVTDYPSNDG